MDPLPLKNGVYFLLAHSLLLRMEMLFMRAFACLYIVAPKHKHNHPHATQIMTAN
ncbi:hypothetical protein L208DRAFT_1413764 [Tricholoma matsutake]|nr:hypothetical protein L208DRAFT_1413764 [Tricholoma matsutake 945]